MAVSITTREKYKKVSYRVSIRVTKVFGWGRDVIVPENISLSYSLTTMHCFWCACARARGPKIWGTLGPRQLGVGHGWTPWRCPPWPSQIWSFYVKRYKRTYGDASGNGRSRHAFRGHSRSLEPTATYDFPGWGINGVNLMQMDQPWLKYWHETYGLFFRPDKCFDKCIAAQRKFRPWNIKILSEKYRQ